MRRGIRKRRAMESGATASGGDTMAPTTKPIGSGNPRSQCSAAATASAEKITQPTARRMMGRRLKRNSRQLIATADQ